MNKVWRDASRTPAFFGVIDTRVCFPIVLFVCHMAWWTFFLAIFSVAFFGLLGRLGYELPVVFRKVKSVLRGRLVYANPWWLKKKRRLI